MTERTADFADGVGQEERNRIFLFEPPDFFGNPDHSGPKGARQAQVRNETADYADFTDRMIVFLCPIRDIRATRG
jgi:hypothetical protein